MDIITETLRWVNAERAARDIGPPLERMPKGQPRNCTQCPVARAFAGAASEVTSTAIFWTADADYNHPTFPPEAVEAFIDGFDEGHYPELSE